MKNKSNKQKKPRHDLGFWLQVFAGLLAGIGTFLLGLAEFLKVIFQLANQPVRHLASGCERKKLTLLDYHSFYWGVNMQIFSILHNLGIFFIAAGVFLFIISLFVKRFSKARKNGK